MRQLALIVSSGFWIAWIAVQDAVAADIHWNGGTSDSWNLQQNWDPFGSPFTTQRVPGDGDTATLATPAGDEVRLFADSAPINGLTISNNIRLVTNGHLLQVDNAGSAVTVVSGADTFLTVNPRPGGYAFETDNLSLSSEGTLFATGDVRIDGQTTVDGNANLSALGSTTAVEFQGDVAVSGGTLFLEQVELNENSFGDGIEVDADNMGFIYIESEDNLDIDGNQNWRIAGGSLLRVATNALNIGVSTPGVLTVTEPDSKVLVVGTPGFPTPPSVVIGAADATNVTGTLVVSDQAEFSAYETTIQKSGLLEIDGGTFHANEDLLIDGGRLNFLSGTLDFNSSSSFVGTNHAQVTSEAPNFLVQDAHFEFSSGADLMAADHAVSVHPLDTAQSELVFDGAGSTLTAGTLLVGQPNLSNSFVTLRNNASASLKRLQIADISGSQDYNATVSLESGAALEVSEVIAIGTDNSTDINRGKLTLDSGAALLYTGASPVQVGSSLTQQGLIVLENGATYNSPQAGLTARPSGIIQVLGGTAAAAMELGGTMNVQGKVVVGSPAMPPSDPGGILRIEGELAIEFGQVDLNQGVLSADIIRITSGGVFNFDGGSLDVGTYHGNLTVSSGNLTPGEGAAGGTTILGNYTHGPGATLAVDIGGTSPGGSHDFVNVIGDVFIDGDLTLTLLNGWTPAASDELLVLSSNSPIIGFLDNVATGQRLGTLDGRGSFVVNYGVGSSFPANQIVLSEFQPSLTADFDHDGDVDGTDFLLIQRNDPSLIPLWQQQYGSSTNPISAVPEPSALALFVASIFTALGKRKRAFFQEPELRKRGLNHELETIRHPQSAVCRDLCHLLTQLQ